MSANFTLKPRPNWIPVVTALIVREGKVLIGQRPEGQSLAGIWEFPGGKIEMGESPEEALSRELKEELGIDAHIGPVAVTGTHNYGPTGILLLFFHVAFWKGEIKPVHHTHLKWVTPRELESCELPEANRKILGKILQVLKAPNQSLQESVGGKL